MRKEEILNNKFYKSGFSGFFFFWFYKNLEINFINFSFMHFCGCPESPEGIRHPGPGPGV